MKDRNKQFLQTRCPKRHDVFNKRQFQEEPDLIKYKYELKYTDEAIRKISEVDAKIKKNNQLLQAKAMLDSDRPKELADKIDVIDAEIKIHLDRSRRLGEDGYIEESEQASEEANRLLQKKEEMLRAVENPLTAQKDQKVCDVCSGLQTANDTEKRVLTHLEGKIHKGFELLRSEIVRLRKRKVDLQAFAEQQKLLAPAESPENTAVLQAKESSHIKTNHSRRDDERHSRHSKSHEKAHRSHHERKHRSRSREHHHHHDKPTSSYY